MFVRSLAFSLLIASAAAPQLDAQSMSQTRSVTASSYFLDAIFAEDPIFSSQSESTVLPGSWTEHAAAPLSSLGSAVNGAADQFGTIDIATGIIDLHGYAIAELYVQGQATTTATSRAVVDFALIVPGSVYFPDADLSTYDAFLGGIAHDRPGTAYAEVRIEALPSGAILYSKHVDMGEPGQTLQDDLIPLGAGSYRMVMEAQAEDATVGFEEIAGSLAAATFDVVAEIDGLTAPVPTSQHVASIVLSVETIGNKKYGVARVTIVNDLGQPVPNATVSGTFTGKPNGTATAVTDANGVAKLTRGPFKGLPAFSFCVTNVVHASLPYAPSSNVETCDTY